MSLKDREARNAYMRQYLAKRYAGRRAAAVASLGGACAICGATEGLEMDHVDPSTKTASIAKLILAKPERLREELAKCQLLCKGCHGAKTSLQRGVPHGGGKKGKHNCPCNLCREARRLYARGRLVR